MDLPTLTYSTHLEFAKKAISYYMPMQVALWNEQAHPPVGNPTKSILVNDLIMLVRKKEVHGQGWMSNAKWPLKTVEWHKVVEILDRSAAVEYKYKYARVVGHMHHMILHPDNLSQFKLADLLSHPQFWFVLSQKVLWSKNV